MVVATGVEADGAGSLRRVDVDVLLLADLADAGDEARRLADLGADGIFTVEGPHDVFFPLVAAAGATDRLDLTTNVALAFPRSPTTVAHQAWDLQRLSGGRFRLGLGAQIRPNIERRYSAVWRQPVDRLREFVGATRAVFRCWQDGEPLDFRGDHYQLTLMQPTFCPAPLESGPPPILVGAMGPRMTAMVAEVADGVLLHPFTTPRFLTEGTAPWLQGGLDAAGRDWSSFEVVLGALVAAGRDEEELAVAVAGVRALAAFYASTPAYRAPLEPYGWEDLQPELRRLSKAGRWDEMAALIDDEVLAAVALVGSPAEVADQLADRVGDLPFAPARLALSLPYAAPAELLGEVIDALG